MKQDVEIVVSDEQRREAELHVSLMAVDVMRENTRLRQELDERKLYWHDRIISFVLGLLVMTVLLAVRDCR